MLTQNEVGKRLGITRQAAAKLEKTALEKCRLLVALGEDFPRRRSETFAAWWGRLRAVLRCSQIRDGQRRRTT